MLLGVCMGEETDFKLAINTFRDEDGFPIGCKCYDCNNESCGVLVFKCEEFNPQAGAATVVMSIPQFNNYVNKFTNCKIFETPEGFYSCMDSGGTIIYVPKFKKENKNHQAI